MKCFNILLFIFLSMNILADEKLIIEKSIYLSPVEKKELTNGDKVVIEVTSKFSPDELRKYIDKKIANQFYIIKYFERDDRKFFEGFVLNPVKPAKKPKGKIEDKKTMISLSDEFKFSFDKERTTKEFLLLDTPYEEEIKKPLWQYLVAAAFILIILLIVLKFFYWPIKAKNLIKKKRKKKALKIIEQLDSVKSREDFENIYKIKKDLDQFVEVDSSALKQFYKRLNSIQYKQKWSEEEKKSLENIYKKIGEVKFKDGV